MSIKKITMAPGVPKSVDFDSRKEWGEAVWLTLIKRLIDCKTPAQAATLLSVYTTPESRSLAARRFAAAEHLRSGLSYRETAKEVWFSSQTIRSIKKAIDGAYHSYYERSKTDRKKKVYTTSISSGGSGRRQFKRRRRTKFGTIFSEY